MTFLRKPGEIPLIVLAVLLVLAVGVLAATGSQIPAALPYAVLTAVAGAAGVAVPHTGNLAADTSQLTAAVTDKAATALGAADIGPAVSAALAAPLAALSGRIGALEALVPGAPLTSATGSSTPASVPAPAAS